MSPFLSEGLLALSNEVSDKSDVRGSVRSGCWQAVGSSGLTSSYTPVSSPRILGTALTSRSSEVNFGTIRLSRNLRLDYDNSLFCTI